MGLVVQVMLGLNLLFCGPHECSYTLWAIPS